MARLHSPSWALLLPSAFLLATCWAPTAAGAPREELAARGLDFTADVFVQRAGDGDLEAIKLFIAAGMAVDARECCFIPVTDARRWSTGEVRRTQQWRGKTALVNAAKHGRLEVVRYLLDRGANPLLQNNYEESALKLAAERGHLEIVRLLIEHGADVSAPTTSGTSPLMAAASGGHVEIAALLVDRGADVNYSPIGKATVANVGNTALIYAAMYGEPGMVRFLLERGADVNKQIGSTGETALDRAANHPEIVRMLRAAGGKKASELR